MKRTFLGSLNYPSSWRTVMNPYARLAKQAAHRWFHEKSIITSEDVAALLSEVRAEYYSGYPFPTANFQQLLTLTKFLVLWMLFDDLVTEQSSAYLQTGKDTLKNYYRALSGELSAAGDEPYLCSWAEVGRELSQSMSERWRRRLAEGFADWLRATLREQSTYRGKGADSAATVFPDLETYLDIRTVSVGALPTFYFIDYVEGFELSQTVLHEPTFDKLHRLGARLILFDNDVMSTEKDLAANWPSAVLILQKHHHLSLEDAVQAAIALHNETLREFVKTEAQLPSFGAEQDGFVNAYLDRLHTVIRGIVEFQHRADRYQWNKQLRHLERPAIQLFEG